MKIPLEKPPRFLRRKNPEPAEADPRKTTSVLAAHIYVFLFQFHHFKPVTSLLCLTVGLNAKATQNMDTTSNCVTDDKSFPKQIKSRQNF